MSNYLKIFSKSFLQIKPWIGTADHKMIGIMYIVVGAISGVLGTFLKEKKFFLLKLYFYLFMLKNMLINNFSKKKTITNSTIFYLFLPSTEKFIFNENNLQVIFIIILFMCVLFISCFYLYKNLDKWVSPYNIIIYSRKQLLISFLLYYIAVILFLLIIAQMAFLTIFVNCSISAKFFLIIFLINILTLSFMIIIKYKILTKQFSLTFYKSSKDYYQKNFIILKNWLASLNNEIKNNDLSKDQKLKIQEKITILTDEEIKYNKLSKTDNFNILTKKVGLLQKLSIKWLKFYNFLLGFFSVFYLFIYFLYFNFSFTISSYTNVSSYYIFGFLLLILIYRFIQHYWYLFTIQKNDGQFAFVYFDKNKGNNLYFGISSEHVFLRFWVATVSIVLYFIYILLNCRILFLIFNKIYFKNNNLLLESFFKIPFKPQINNLILPVSNEFNSFMLFSMSLTFLFIIIFFSLILISFYCHLLADIYVQKLGPVFLHDKQEPTIFLTESFDEKKVKENLENYKQGIVFEIGTFYEYQIAWFKYAFIFLKMNNKIHTGFTKIKYFFYLFIGSSFWIIILCLIIFMINYYSNIYSTINNISVDITTTTTASGFSFFRRLGGVARGAVNGFRNPTNRFPVAGPLTAQSNEKKNEIKNENVEDSNSISVTVIHDAGNGEKPREEVYSAHFKQPKDFYLNKINISSSSTLTTTNNQQEQIITPDGTKIIKSSYSQTTETPNRFNFAAEFRRMQKFDVVETTNKLLNIFAKVNDEDDSSNKK
jgi:hypothetical protein